MAKLVIATGVRTAKQWAMFRFYTQVFQLLTRTQSAQHPFLQPLLVEWAQPLSFRVLAI